MIDKDVAETQKQGALSGGRFVRPRHSGLGQISAKAETLHPAALGVSLYILVSVGRLQELVPFFNGLPLAKIALVLAFVGIVFAPAERNRPLRGMPLAKYMLALGALGVFSVAVSVWKSHSLEFLLGTFVGNLLLFFLLAKSADNEKTRNLYFAALVVSAMLLSIPALSLSVDERARVATAYDANDLASVLVSVLPFCIVAFFSGRRRFFWLVTSLVLAAGAVATGSRGGFLGLVAAVLYLTWVPLPGRQKGTAGRGRRIVLVGIVGLFSAVVVGGAAWHRIGTLTHLQNDYNLSAETGRLAIWHRGLTIIAERPWGVGLDAFEAAEGMEGGRYKAAHNSLLQIGAELGIPGLLVFIALCLGGYRLLGRFLAQERERGDSGEGRAALAASLRAGLVGFFVTGFFLSHAYAPVLYALLGMAVAVVPLRDKYEIPTQHPAVKRLQSKRVLSHETNVRTGRR
jgi:putative inorganic carbon (HCO3(-)) transporter